MALAAFDESRGRARGICRGDGGTLLGPGSMVFAAGRRPGSSHASEVSLAVNGAGQAGTAWAETTGGMTRLRAAVGDQSHTLLRGHATVR